MADDFIGRTLGRYKITALVGRGGMATVYKATHPGLEQTVAVKVLHSHMATDADLLGRFQQEARAVAALRHPSIVRVVDFDCIDDVYFMVMEYVDGDTMSSYLRTMSARGQRMSPAEVLQVFEPLCSAVDYAHGLGMVHRDIKPSNVLLTTQGEPILTDYGIAKMIGVSQHTATGTVMGSAYYMSPEQAQGIAVDGRSDIYSMGVMLFEVLAGHVPYEGDTLATVLVKHITAPVPAVCALNQDLPPVLDGLMRVALAKDPSERFQTGKALAVALRQGLGPATAGEGAAPVAGTVVERPGAGGAATRGSAGTKARTSAPARTANTRTAGHDVFLSYAVADKAVADSVCDALEADGIRCWMAPRDVLPGQSYAKALSSAIHTARVFILVFSSATNQSQQVERELDMAVASRLPLVPLRVEDVMPRESIEYYLAGQHWLDAITPPLDVHLARLSEAIAALLEQTAPAADATGAVAEPAVWATGAPEGTPIEPLAPVAPSPAPAPVPQEATTFEAPVAPPSAAERTPAPQEATAYEEPVAPDPGAPEPAAAHATEPAPAPEAAIAAGVIAEREAAEEAPVASEVATPPAADTSGEALTWTAAGVAAAAVLGAAAPPVTGEPEAAQPAQEMVAEPETAQVAEEVAPEPEMPAEVQEETPAEAEAPEPQVAAEESSAVAEAEAETAPVPEVTPQAAVEPEQAVEPEPAVEPAAAAEPAVEPEPEPAVEPEPAASADSDGTTIERPVEDADLAASTTYEAPAEATPAAAATSYEAPAEAGALSEADGLAAATTYERPAGTGGLAPETAYEAPAAVAPAAETAYEAPADVTPAGAMTYGSASDAAAFAAAATFEPAAEPQASDVAAGTAAAPAAAAAGAAAQSGRSAAARAPSREGLHKPTLFVAAGVGVAWVVILFVLDKFVL